MRLQLNKTLEAMEKAVCIVITLYCISIMESFLMQALLEKEELLNIHKVLKEEVRTVISYQSVFWTDNQHHEI